MVSGDCFAPRCERTLRWWMFGRDTRVLMFVEVMSRWEVHLHGAGQGVIRTAFPVVCLHQKCLVSERY